MGRFTYSCGAISDAGDRREENQDRILVLTGEIKKRPCALLVVADGMGGLSFGAQVSSYIAEQFNRWWYDDFSTMIHNGMEQAGDIRELLEQEIWDINQAVFQFNNRMECRSGSTLSLLLLYGRRYYIENMGDSRIYRLRGRRLRQLTIDQSLAAKMVESHCMTEDGASHSPAKNKLTMCMGMFAVPQAGYQTGQVLKKDCFLVCSDGLYNPLGQPKLEEGMRIKGKSPGERAEYLRQMIGAGEAKDNVSAIVAEIS